MANSKHGRHKEHCRKYKAEGRREKNKEKKQRKITKILEKKKRRKNGNTSR